MYYYSIELLKTTFSSGRPQGCRYLLLQVVGLFGQFLYCSKVAYAHYLVTSDLVEQKQ